MKKLSIGSWAYIFNQEQPTNDFHAVVHTCGDLGYDGVELGGFAAAPGVGHRRPGQREAQRSDSPRPGVLRPRGRSMGTEARLSAEAGPYMAAFGKNSRLRGGPRHHDDARRYRRADRAMRDGQDPKLGSTGWQRRSTCARRWRPTAGINICWEFEPGFAFNKPSEIVQARGRACGRRGTRTSACCTTPATPTCAPSSARTRPATKETLPGGELELLREAQGEDHPRPPDRLATAR